jgi:hypothetical protein
MFIRLGNRFVNSEYVVEIRLRAPQAGESNATFVMHDGSALDGFAIESEVEALTEKILQAPNGFEAHRVYDLDFDDAETPEELDWKPVVAFAVYSGSRVLDPITADDGRLDKYAVRAPNGKVHTSSEEFFSSDDYRTFLRRKKVKAA